MSPSFARYLFDHLPPLLAALPLLDPPSFFSILFQIYLINHFISTSSASPPIDLHSPRSRHYLYEKDKRQSVGSFRSSQCPIMALSLSNFLYAICAFSLFSLSKTETVTFNWNVTWVTANPDGMFNRRTMGINGQWPIPVVNITKGDRVVVNLYNDLGDQSTSLHFHGLFQNGTTEMDGPVGVSQCGVPPGGSFTYNFTVDQPGTYW